MAGTTGRRDAFGEILCDSFDAQSGTATEPSSEGGRNVGFIADGDWLEYRDVDFGGRAAEAVAVRVASGAPAGASGFVEVQLDSRRGGPPAASISVQNTGGWQSWRTASANLSSPAGGKRVVFLNFRSGQAQEFVNVRFFRFLPSPSPPPPPPPPGRDAFRPIAAASFDAQSGTQTEPSSEGGLSVGFIGNGDWLEYRDLNFGARTARRFTARVASGAGPRVSGLVEVRLGDRASAPIAVLGVADTGGWQSWLNATGGDLTSPVFGTQTVFLTFFSRQPLDFMNVLSFSFSE